MTCEKCGKNNIIITDTKIDKRYYRCLDCDFEWEGKPSEKERKEFQ